MFPAKYTFQRERWESDSSTCSLQHAKAWISQCDECHECLPQIQLMPTRLLDLGSHESPEISLVAGKDHGKEVKYVVLSHCWGDNLKSRLFQNNIETFKQGINIEELPQTFIDVAKVTKRLGLRYLWIDGLCIIQDSPSDWRAESGMMRDVYRGSYLNISATASRDSTEGLFRSRPPVSSYLRSKILESWLQTE